MADLNRLKSFYEETGEEPTAEDIEAFDAPLEKAARSELTKKLESAQPLPNEMLGAFFERREREAGLGPSGVQIQRDVSIPKPPVAMPEPAQAPVPAREANATMGTTTSGIVAPAAPATDGGKAAEPVVATGAPSVGAGGDEGIDRTALAEALARGGEAIFRGVTGRALPTGIPEMLAAVRQRREAQAQREREIGAERGRQEQLFQQQRGLKAMEIEAEQAKELRREEQNRRNNELELNTAIERNPEYKDSLENLRGYTGKGDVFKRFMDMALSDIRAGKLKTDQEIARAKAPAQIEGLEATAELKAEKAKTEAVEREKRRAEIDYLKTKADNEKGVREAKTEADARKEFNKANNSNTGKELKNAAAAFDALAKFDKDFVFGRAPEWLGELDFATAEKAPALAPRARQLRSRMEAALAPIRKALFGASLTGTEKTSFDLVSNTGQLLTTPVALIADAINTLRIAAARQTQDFYNSFLNDYPAMTTRNLSTSEVYKDVLKPEGAYGDIFKLAAPAAAATKPPKPVAPAGKVVLWNKKAGAWRAFDPETADRGKAAGALEE